MHSAPLQHVSRRYVLAVSVCIPSSDSIIRTPNEKGRYERNPDGGKERKAGRRSLVKTSRGQMILILGRTPPSRDLDLPAMSRLPARLQQLHARENLPTLPTIEI